MSLGVATGKKLTVFLVSPGRGLWNEEKHCCKKLGKIFWQDFQSVNFSEFFEVWVEDLFLVVSTILLSYRSPDLAVNFLYFAFWHFPGTIWCPQTLRPEARDAAEGDQTHRLFSRPDGSLLPTGKSLFVALKKLTMWKHVNQIKRLPHKALPGMCKSVFPTQVYLYFVKTLMCLI